MNPSAPQTETTLTQGTLSIDRSQSPEGLTLVWRGKSNDRDPGRFLMPLLQATLERAELDRCLVVLDFAPLEYMNSSTFSPLVKALEHASRSGLHVRVEYSGSRKWQALSFTALRAFATPDGRISFRAK